MGAKRGSAPDPAPAEIRRRCAEIRSMWSELTHRVRAGYGKNYDAVQDNQAWFPPMVSTRELEDFLVDSTN